MATSLPSAGPADHQGRPPTDPGSLSGVITGTGPGPRGATIDIVTTTVTAAPPRPPLVRPRSGRAIAGVAVGTAAHLRQDPLVVRVAFALLATTGIGIVAYGLLWLTMPVAAPGEEPDEPPLPGWRPRGARQWIATVVLGLVAASLLGQLTRWTSSDVVLPLVLVGAGLAVIWRQLDTDRTLAVAGTRWTLAGGVLLAGAGLVFLLVTTGQLANARNGFAATLVILAGIVLATAPLWRRLLDSRAAERTARIRSEERAAVAAHLHDSVLQTLALIQRHADDQQAVARLARGQERELRSWLYEPAAAAGGTWTALVSQIVAEVEADHELIVDPVVVGDAPVDDALVALGAAAREALVNAAKHAGVTSADLYTEVTAQSVSVFVRDRGAGFEPAAVPGDRRGLSDSVTGRVARIGGTATVRSAPGEGTEVELVLPREVAA